jgi:hypothetical protein
MLGRPLDCKLNLVKFFKTERVLCEFTVNLCVEERQKEFDTTQEQVMEMIHIPEL